MKINNLKVYNTEKLNLKLKPNDTDFWYPFLKKILSIELGVALAAGAYAYPKIYNNAVNYQAEKYCTELSQYNEYIKKYAKEIKQLGLSDLEIIVKLMNDSWASIDGYSPEEEIIAGHHRLTFLIEGKGVCRSFADDFTATINEINPEYNAENIIVHLNNQAASNTEVLDIQRTILEDVEEEQEEKQKQHSYKLITNAIGNHMVTLLTIPNTSIKLIVDPTNLLIGTFQDDKIYVFNSSNDKLLSYKALGDFIADGAPVSEILKDRSDSYKNDSDIKELNKEYGIVAQRNAYNKIKSLPNNPTYKFN